LTKATWDLPRTLGALRNSAWSEDRIGSRSVKDELRDNLIRKLQCPTPLFPGIVGYEDSVVPQVVNAILSRHNFILLGLRGQAKTRLIRMLTTLLDDVLPYVRAARSTIIPYRRFAGAAAT
jgi:magnesium chelatase subunit I